MNIQFQNKENQVDLTFEFEQDDVPSQDDAHVKIVVHSHGFSGVGDCWVQADVIQRFFEELIMLEKTRLGTAQLMSISPGELELTVCSINNRGHIAIYGKASRRLYASETSFHHGCF